MQSGREAEQCGVSGRWVGLAHHATPLPPLPAAVPLTWESGLWEGEREAAASQMSLWSAYLRKSRLISYTSRPFKRRDKC